MAEPPDKNQNANDGYPKLRREKRTNAVIPISVSGFDEFGHFFNEHTATLNVSANGACFRLRADVTEDALLALQSDRSTHPGLPGHPVFYQVAWREKAEPGAIIGVARTDGGISPPAVKPGDTSDFTD
jgi:PilZ domain